MKISEVKINDLKDYAHVYHNEDDKVFDAILAACKSYISGYTGLTTEKMDTKEDLTIALKVLANEMYDNRSFSVENDKINPVIKSILDMHSINLL
ncbi:head-tail connector protein [Neobacillus niacini]|uniref:head-tail connector protein n=1 Tax=Neobacillus niacini TaxID=86668 RepID=UPI0021CB9172|nr:head-tail connector protein [Neobacillus niacini]MCM3763449.1 head-tail connector protein [Neobacillus niacini]